MMCMGGVETVAAAVDALVHQDPADYGDAESVEALHRLLARMDAFTTQAAAAFDASGAWADDGARDAAAWMATRCRLPRRDARRRVGTGRRLRHLPACAEAWLAGEITQAHVATVGRLLRPTTVDVLARDEDMLVGYARTLRFEEFARAVAYWTQHADPEGADREDADRRAEREVYLESSFRGMRLGRIALDPVSGTIVGEELGRLEEALFAADWAEAQERLGRDPKVDELGRTSHQRRADALVEMATRSRTMPDDGRRPLPLFSVFVGYETLHGRICELADGTVLSPGTVVGWLDGALLERAVFGPGARVEVGAATRFFTGATRRAIEVRDRRCTHRYCDRPASECEVDHIIPFSAGGPTTQENGRLLCPFHNRLRNQRPPPAA